MWKAIGQGLAAFRGWWWAVSALGPFVSGALGYFGGLPLAVIFVLCLQAFLVILAIIALSAYLFDRYTKSQYIIRIKLIILDRLNDWEPNKIDLTSATRIWSISDNTNSAEWDRKFKSLKKACRDQTLPVAVLKGKNPNAQTVIDLSDLRAFPQTRGEIPKDES